MILILSISAARRLAPTKAVHLAKELRFSTSLRYLFAPKPLVRLLLCLPRKRPLVPTPTLNPLPPTAIESSWASPRSLIVGAKLTYISTSIVAIGLGLRVLKALQELNFGDLLEGQLEVGITKFSDCAFGFIIRLESATIKSISNILWKDYARWVWAPEYPILPWVIRFLIVVILVFSYQWELFRRFPTLVSNPAYFRSPNSGLVHPLNPHDSSKQSPNLLNPLDSSKLITKPAETSSPVPSRPHLGLNSILK